MMRLDCTKSKPLCAIFLAVLVLVPFLTLGAVAQQSSEPETITGADFRAHARSRWQRTDVIVLGPNDELTTEKRAPTKKRSWTISRQTSQSISIVILIALGIGAAFVAINNRMGGGLFRRNRENVSIAHEDQTTLAGLDDVASATFRIDDLSRITDPIKALHTLLANVLVRAAGENNIALRRSLTARDIVANLSPDWPHSERLRQLVYDAEPFLFGGHPLQKSRLTQMTDLARPLFHLANKGRSAR